MRAAEATLEASGGQLKPPNWPRCRPTVRIAIQEDTLPEHVGLVRACYFCWLLAAAGYGVNLLTISIIFFTGAPGSGVGCFFFAALTSILGIMFSMYFWFFALYRACQEGAGTWAWWKFFFHMGVHLAWCLWMIVSVPGRAGCSCAGFFIMLNLWDFKGGLGTFLGVMSVVNIGLWTCCFLLGLYIWSWSVHKYRLLGARLANADAERSTTVFGRADTLGFEPRAAGFTAKFAQNFLRPGKANSASPFR